MQSNWDDYYEVWTKGEGGSWAEGKVDDSISVAGGTRIRDAVLVDLACRKWESESRNSYENQVQKQEECCCVHFLNFMLGNRFML